MVGTESVQASSCKYRQNSLGVLRGFNQLPNALSKESVNVTRGICESLRLQRVKEKVKFRRFVKMSRAGHTGNNLLRSLLQLVQNRGFIL